MSPLITIFREIRDPRDLNTRHDLAAMLFMALAATLCGAKSCVEIADFAAANEDLLSEIVDLPHGVPSHDSFSRVFRLLDPEEMAGVFTRFRDALRAALGLGAANGVVAVDGKSLRRERGRAFMPPLMVSVFDAETRLSLMARHAPGGDEVAATLEALKAVTLKGCTVTADALHCHPAMAAANGEGPASSRSRPARQLFPASPLSAASNPNEPPAAGPLPRSITPSSRRPAPRAASWKSCEPIGASRTSFTGRSTSSSMRTTPERARTTLPKTLPSCAASLSTSSEPILTTDPSPAK
jgi:predicted transposase YbfD/YdcC